MKPLSQTEVDRLLRERTEEVASDEVCADPLVSILVITFNHGPFVERALQSVCSQQTTFPFEVVIGEDASSDDTCDIVLDFQRRFPAAVRVLRSTENLGRLTGSGQLNLLRCMRAARGKYVARLEGDDYWTSPSKLQSQLDVLEADDSLSLCHHRVEHIDADDNPLRLSPYPYGSSRVTFADFLEHSANYVYTGSIVYRRSACPETPPEFWPAKLADWPLAMELLSHGDGFFLDQTLSRYRKHAGGVWGKKPLAWRSWQKLRVVKIARRRFAPRNSAQFDRLIGKLRTQLAMGLRLEGKTRRARTFRRGVFRRHAALTPWIVGNWLDFQWTRVRGFLRRTLRGASR